MITIFFGGAFDPFHEEHFAITEGAKKELNADRVVIYPSDMPPHKNPRMTAYEHRLEMVKLALSALPYTVVDTIEHERSVTNYSYEVLPILKEKYPSDEYWFLIGGDSMVHFSQWVHPETIAKEIKIAVAPRGDVAGLDEAAEEARRRYGATVRILRTAGKAASSSLIRTQAEFGWKPDGVIPAVGEYIVQNGLYRKHRDIIEKLKEDLPERTFNHVCRTTVMAVKFNTYLNLPYEKVFLAALLHDCAKPFATEMVGVLPPVVHQYTGAERAASVYGITDTDILEAIRYHTTGKPNMTVLQKLIYLADKLEEGRRYEGVEELRALTYRDFDAGFVATLRHSLSYVGREECDALTKECLAYYTNAD